MVVAPCLAMGCTPTTVETGVATMYGYSLDVGNASRGSAADLWRSEWHRPFSARKSELLS